MRVDGTDNDYVINENIQGRINICYLQAKGRSVW